MKRIRQWLALLILFLFLPAVPGVLATSLSHIKCDCGYGRCECFIQYGDECRAVKAIIQLLKDQGYLDSELRTEELNGTVEKAIIRFQEDSRLEPTGQMDDDTLTLLLWKQLPEELDKTNLNVRTVYIPVNAGDKMHLNPKCSNMDHPRKISERNAIKLGFDGCQRCYVGR